MDDFLDQVRNDHHQFDKGRLEDHVGKEPFGLFNSWLKEATALNINEPNAMSVSTVDGEGKVSSRIVYLREISSPPRRTASGGIEGGFVFYTNYQSQKGKALEQHPQAHLLFFWPELERQVSVSGTVVKAPEAMSDAYFASRPRSSQLGAWASQQSAVLDSRDELEKRVEEVARKFPKDVPRPPHWGGYILQPDTIEFWQGRPSRLHDRIVFEKSGGSWNIYRRNP